MANILWEVLDSDDNREEDLSSDDSCNDISSDSCEEDSGHQSVQTTLH